jgi:nanoRNase/pAp phosphatase (c-di-AMP/oligoRNAs hydrolase)
MIATRLKNTKLQGKILILPHDNPDPDSLASAWGLAYFLKKVLGADSDIGYAGLIGRAENRALVRVLGMPLKKCRPNTFGQYGTIFMVDCQPHTGNSSLPAEIDPDVVIDHHPRRESTRIKQWAYIDESQGATSTIVTSALVQQGITLPKDLSTALFYAIRSETKDLGWEGTSQDYRTYLALLPRIDFAALYRIEHPPLSPEYYRMLKEAINRCRIYHFLAVCPLGEVPYPELPAEIADFLIFRENVDMSLVMGYYGRDLYLSLRSLHRNQNSAAIMQELVHGLGSGGGHEIMAGGKVADVSLAKAKEIEKRLSQKILQRFALSRIRPVKLYSLLDRKAKDHKKREKK